MTLLLSVSLRASEPLALSGAKGNQSQRLKFLYIKLPQAKEMFENIGDLRYHLTYRNYGTNREGGAKDGLFCGAI